MKVSIEPIKIKEDYKKALKRIDLLWGSEENTLEGDELDILITLVDKYEEENFPIFPPDPVEAIKFRMEQMGITQTDLGKMIGRNRASEILNRKRSPSLKIIKTLKKELRISADLLIF